MVSKAKLVLVAVSMIFGIPLTMSGLQLKEGMFLKQMVNCQEDASNSVMSLLDRDLNTIRGGEFEHISSYLKTCTKDINPRIGVVTFLRNEHERNTKETAAIK